MQAGTAVSSHKHDQDLLLASNVSVFKEWLKAQGIEVREPEPAHSAQGVHYWVVPVPGKAKPKAVSVQEGSGRHKRYAQTHHRLRSLINRFLTSPLTTAVRAAQASDIGKCPSAPASTHYLLTQADIKRALSCPPVKEPVWGDHGAVLEGHDVFAVRLSGTDRDGASVAIHARVYGQGARQVVQVLGYPFDTNLQDLAPLAKELHQRASALPSATILVDTAGIGLQFFHELEQLGRTDSLRRYGLMMGAPLPKDAGYFNRRSKCSVLAAQAIKAGRVKLKWPDGEDSDAVLARFGCHIPYTVNEHRQHQVASPKERATKDLPCPDLFETLAMCFHDLDLPTPAEKPAAPAAEATPKKLSQDLIDLRDDFAITCPLTQDEGEDLAAFAVRRWAYAQAMLDARPR
ncbi:MULTISPECIES: hypothetical protein [unclassified Pseudomonas]|uniref:hypothetical protein n=1 Tax=unclassified Pseudomonas TaxID=196821 RepID=UPI000A1DE185|nr:MULTISPECIES: hypothetical protein [unclassified Pseudomonas]